LDDILDRPYVEGLQRLAVARYEDVAGDDISFDDLALDDHSFDKAAIEGLGGFASVASAGEWCIAHPEMCAGCV
jgi:hypothetical protein